LKRRKKNKSLFEPQRLKERKERQGKGQTMKRIIEQERAMRRSRNQFWILDSVGKDALATKFHESHERNPGRGSH
jgi:hypothetical protein